MSDTSLRAYAMHANPGAFNIVLLWVWDGPVLTYGSIRRFANSAILLQIGQVHVGLRSFIVKNMVKSKHWTCAHVVALAGVTMRLFTSCRITSHPAGVRLAEASTAFARGSQVTRTGSHKESSEAAATTSSSRLIGDMPPARARAARGTSGGIAQVSAWADHAPHALCSSPFSPNPLRPFAVPPAPI